VLVFPENLAEILGELCVVFVKTYLTSAHWLKDEIFSTCFGSFALSSTLYYEKLHYLTVKKIIIWYKFLLLDLLDRIFQNFWEQLLTYSLLKGIEVELKLFNFFALVMLVGPWNRGGSRKGHLGRCPLKPTKVILFTVILHSSENNIRDIRPFWRPLFCHSNVVM